MKAFQVDIPKRSRCCFQNAEKFVPDMEYYSVLYEDEKLRIQRKDFCKTCWEQHMTSEMLQNSRGYWKSKIEGKNMKIPSSRAERGLKLLKQLMENPEASPSEIYVLVILLAHLRLLALRKEFVEEGRTFQLYEILRHDEFIKIPTLIPHTEEIEEIRQSLAFKLKSEV